MRYLVVIAYTFGFVLLGICIAFTAISVGFSKKRIRKTTGFLVNVKHERNVYIGRPATFYPHYVSAVYSYRVSNKQFHITWRAPGMPHNMPQRVKVFYQSKHPRFAYIEKGPFIQPFVAIVTGVLSIICIVLASILLCRIIH